MYCILLLNCLYSTGQYKISSEVCALFKWNHFILPIRKKLKAPIRSTKIVSSYRSGSTKRFCLLQPKRLRVAKISPQKNYTIYNCFITMQIWQVLQTCRKFKPSFCSPNLAPLNSGDRKVTIITRESSGNSKLYINLLSCVCIVQFGPENMCAFRVKPY